MFFKFLRVSVIFCLVPALSAQEPSSTMAEIRLLAFTPKLQQKEAYAHDPAAAEGTPSVPAPIKSYLNHEFATVPLKGRKVVFTTKPDRGSMNRDGELIGEGALPENVNSAVLVFLPGKPGSKALCQVMPLDDSKKAFPAGSFHITNLSPAPVRLTLESTNYDIQPGKVLLIQDPPVREGQMSGMRAFVLQNNTWNPISTGLWPHPGRSRGVKVLYQDPASGKIQLRAYDDGPPREKVAPAP